MRTRFVLGWCVAQAFRFSGARRRAVARARGADAILPIVIHAAPAAEVRAILGWLGRAGVLDHVWLSFDDGWREFLDTVAVLEEFQKPATVFVAPGEIRRGDVWTDGISVAKRQMLYGKSEAERVALLTQARREVEAARACTGRRLMTEAEVREVSRHPLVRIGNHTWSHLSCPHRPTEEVLDEIERAQATLTEWCGYAPTDFAYPFGRGTPELDVEIRKRGMTPHYTRQGLVTKDTMGNSRNMVYEGMSLAENIGRVLMAWPKVGETL